MGFEKDLVESATKMHPQDPLEEVDLGDEVVKRMAYISANINPGLRLKVIKLLHEFKYCFSRYYNEMSCLSKDLVELGLPIKPGKNSVKQMPRRFVPEVMYKIKEEIEILLKSKFMQTARYVEWHANIIPMIKKNRTLRTCIDLRDLNVATPKDKYPMLVA